MENVIELIEEELGRVEPNKRHSAVIAMRTAEYDWFFNSAKQEQRDGPWSQGLTEHEGQFQPYYAGMPVIRMDTLIEPVIIYTQAEPEAANSEYLARD
jgi:hypothetical protein